MSTRRPVSLVVGAGQSGARAAKAMRDSGFQGSITLLGAEPHFPYERPLLSKTLLLDRSAAVPFVFDKQTYVDRGIEVRIGCSVEAIDRKNKVVSLADGASLRFDHLLLATGCRVRRLEIEGMPADQPLTLRSLNDSRRIEELLATKPDVAVVGGGFIGLEVAASAAARGCKVSVIEAAPQLLPRLGCEVVSDIVLAHHVRAGVAVFLGARVSRAESNRLFLSGGQEVCADLVIAGIGVEPDTRLAEAARIDVQDGILVDEYGMTSDPAIYAAGDVTRHFSPCLGRHVRLESWQNANDQAEAAGRSMGGSPTVYSEIPWLWSDQGDLNLQAAGAPLTVDRVIVRREQDDCSGISVLQFQGGCLVGGITVNRGKEMPLIRRLLAHPLVVVDPESLSDAKIPLRRFLPERRIHG